MKHRIDALLFDLGGVVMEIDFGRAFACWAKHAGCDPAQIARGWSANRAYERHEIAEISNQEYFAALRELCGISITDQQFREGWNDIFVGEMPGIAELLANVKARLPLYAFSNTNAEHESIWPKMFADILVHFDRIFISHAMRLRKPDRAAFDHVVREIGVPAQRILFFDDTLANVEGARAAGLQAVHVTGPDTVAKTLAELQL